MNRLKFFLPKRTLLTLYNTLVLSYLNYAILTWGTSTSQCNKLLLLQKKAVRIISNTGYLTHTNPLFAELGILKINDLFNLNLGKFMFKYKHGLLPPNFNDCFSTVSVVHSYSTRSATKGDYYVNYNHTSVSRHSLLPRCVTFWNNLSTDLTRLSSLSVFTRKLKIHLISAYNDNQVI